MCALNLFDRVLSQVQIFDPAYLRARTFWHQEQTANPVHEYGSNRVGSYLIWMCWFYFVTLMIGGLRTIVSYLDSLGEIVLFLLGFKPQIVSRLVVGIEGRNY